MCVDASAVTVRADWRSQSVSQSVGSAPAATYDRVDFSSFCIRKRTHAYDTYTRLDTPSLGIFCRVVRGPFDSVRPVSLAPVSLDKAGRIDRT